MSSSAAFFDVDGTLVKANIVDYYLYFATYNRSAIWRTAWIAGFAFKAVYYLVLDLISRSRFNKVFYRNYGGMSVTQLQQWSQLHFEETIRPRLFPQALDCIAEHKARGEAVVLVTGSLDFIVAPLAAFLEVDATLAASLQVEDGRYTGEMAGPPVGEEEKARIVRMFAQQRGIDLAQSYAYGDSRADLPMLRSVGHPVPVNPSAGLRKVAEQESWSVKKWRLSDAGHSLY